MSQPHEQILARLIDLSGSGHARIYLEERQGAAWVLRCGGRPEDVARFLQGCELGPTTRVRAGDMLEDFGMATN